MSEQTDEALPVYLPACVALPLCQRLTLKRALQMEAGRLCYFPLFEYSIGLLIY